MGGVLSFEEPRLVRGQITRRQHAEIQQEMSYD
jgi:hypothetical protein